MMPLLDDDRRRAHKAHNELHSALLVGGLGLVTAFSAWLLWSWTGVLVALAWIGALYVFAPRLPPEMIMKLYRAQPIDPKQGEQIVYIVGELARLEPGREIVWSVAPDLPVLQADALLLQVAVRNLLGNARAHTPPGTTVTVAAAADGDRVRVSVHDDGPGLPPELVPRAFERFTRGDSSRTRSSGGAGLGLSLVAAIAEAHGGTVEVDSRPGSTTFVVALPR